MNHRRDYRRGGNDFNRSAESIYREHLENDKRFGGGWAHDWDSNPDSQNGSYRGGPRNMHWSDDRDYSNREGHGYYADEQSATVYSGGNRGRGDYGRSSAYGRRGYYDRGTYFEDAGRYTPRFHERREYDEYDRRDELEGGRYNPRSNEGRSYEREAFRARERDGYDPVPDRYGADRYRGMGRPRGREYDDRFGAAYRSDVGHEHWYEGDQLDDRTNDEGPRRRQRRGFTPGDMGGQYGGRNTW